MPRSVLNAYERGRREPGVEALARLLDAAGFTLDLRSVAGGVADERAGRILSLVLELTESLPSPGWDAPASTRRSALGRRLLAVHEKLGAAAPHAVGGGVALAYCGAESRVTRLLEIHVFVGFEEVERVLAELGPGVPRRFDDAPQQGQVSLWWDHTPLDLTFDAGAFGREAAPRARTVPFEGSEIPVLDPVSLAVCKAMSNRMTDWVDIEAMVDADSLDIPDAFGWLARILGADHDATRRLAALVQSEA